jgi:hypothetical protein
VAKKKKSKKKASKKRRASKLIDLKPLLKDISDAQKELRSIRKRLAKIVPLCRRIRVTRA